VSTSIGPLAFLPDHGRWVRHHEDLWTTHVGLSALGTHFGRRATAVRSDGRWLIVGPVVPDEAARRALDDAGTVETLVIASAVHNNFVPESVAAWPEARVLRTRGAKRAGIPPDRLDDLANGLPEPFGANLHPIPLEGMPKINEVVFVHAPSRTLIVADLFFGIDARYPAWTRTVARLLGAFPGPGTSRVFRAFVRDRAAFAGSLDRILEHDVRRLVTSHGAVFEDGARTAVERLRDRYAGPGPAAG
jgi:hypothetical protein